MLRVSADWVREKLSAARAKLRCSASATACRSRRSSTPDVPGTGEAKHAGAADGRGRARAGRAARRTDPWPGCPASGRMVHDEPRPPSVRPLDGGGRSAVLGRGGACGRRPARPAVAADRARRPGRADRRAAHGGGAAAGLLGAGRAGPHAVAAVRGGRRRGVGRRRAGAARCCGCSRAGSGAGAALLLGLVVQVVARPGRAGRRTGRVRPTPSGRRSATLVLVAAFGAVGRWLLGGGRHATTWWPTCIRRARRQRRRRAGATGGSGDPPGVVVVQIDGLPHPVLMHGIMSGNLPTLSRWVRSGSHTASEWWARVPSTTPASQAGLLHGSNDGHPGLPLVREGPPGRLVVANRPADAALIEARLSDGRGLLADGGVSVSNLFSGDAGDEPHGDEPLGPARRPRAGRGLHPVLRQPVRLRPGAAAHRGEMVKELYQGRRQRLRGIEPRIRRRGSYVAAARADQRPAARPQRRAGRRAHGARGAGGVRGLRRLRRDRPPRRGAAPGVARRARRAGRGAGDAGARRGGGVAALPVRRPVRPRAEPGRDVPPAVRADPGGDGHRAGRPRTARRWPRPATSSRGGR